MKRILAYILFLTVAASSFAKTQVYMLRPTGYLREDKGRGGVEWAMTIPEGTVLTLESPEPVKLTLITQKEKYDNVEFYKVSYEKKSYYVGANEIALDGFGLSVILDNTTLFRNAAVSSFLNAQLEKATLVVTGLKKEYAGLNFTEIQYWSSNPNGGGEVRKRYVLTDKVSQNSKDLEAVRIVDTALSIQNADKAKERTMKLELFKNAKKLNTSDSITDYVQATYDKLFGEQEIEQAYGSIVSDDGSKINVRNSPVDGKVLGQFENGSQVLVSKKSVETSKIDNVTDNWYYVSDEAAGLEGWVFGKFVKIDTAENDSAVQENVETAE